jgi:hypothetical protein
VKECHNRAGSLGSLVGRVNPAAFVALTSSQGQQHTETVDRWKSEVACPDITLASNFTTASNQIDSKPIILDVFRPAYLFVTALE